MKKIIRLFMSSTLAVSALTAEETNISLGSWERIKTQASEATNVIKGLLPLTQINKLKGLQVLNDLEKAQKAALEFKQQLLKTISKANEIIQRPKASKEAIDSALKTIKQAGDYLVNVETQISELDKAIADVKTQLVKLK